MATKLEAVRQAFYDRIESDDTFFQYFGQWDEEEIQAIADERADTYIKEAIALLRRKCKPDIGFIIDNTVGEFVDDLTDDEIHLIGGDLAFQVYIGRDIAKMRTRVNTFTSTDLKALHSPANERNSYMAMYNSLCAENLTKIMDYSSRDRLSGKFKSVNVEGVGS